MLYSLSISTPLSAFQNSTLPPSRARFRQIQSTSATAGATSTPNTSIHAASDKQECTSLYEVLGISVSASNLEIKAAYRRLAKICHPDVATAIGRKDLLATDEFMMIHEAYSTLSDPEKRALYDSKLLWRRQSPLTSASRFTRYNGRNWETDQCW